MPLKTGQTSEIGNEHGRDIKSSISEVKVRFIIVNQIAIFSINKFFALHVADTDVQPNAANPVESAGETRKLLT